MSELITKEGYLANRYACQKTLYIRWECIGITKDVESAAMLSQIVYWHEPDTKNRTRLRIKHDGKLWLVRYLDDWWDECGVIPRHAMNRLKELNTATLIDVKRLYWMGKSAHYISLNWDVYIAKLNEQYSRISADFSSNLEADIKAKKEEENVVQNEDTFGDDCIPKERENEGTNTPTPSTQDGRTIPPEPQEKCVQEYAPNYQNGNLVSENRIPENAPNYQNGNLVADQTTKTVIWSPETAVTICRTKLPKRYFGPDQTTESVIWSPYTYNTNTLNTNTPPLPPVGGCADGDVSVKESKVPEIQNPKESWIVTRYNEVAEKLHYPTVTKYTEKRASKVRARLKDFPEKKIWIEMFNRLEQSEYFTGPENSWFGFDYIIRSSETFDKIRTGAFDFKRAKVPVNHLPQNTPNGQLPAHLQNTGFVMVNGKLVPQTTPH